MNISSRSSSSNPLQSASQAYRLLLTLSFALIGLSGCFENFKGITLTPKLTSTTASTYTSSFAFNLSRVVLNQADPAGTFDVWDDGTTSIAKYCPSTTSSTTTSTINCSCVYDYQYTNPTTSVTSSQEILVDPTYAEGDLLRCPYAQIPPSVSSVSVSVATKDGAHKSSAVTFSFGTSSGILDTSKDYTFARIYRYTCRLKTYVPNTMDLGSGIYDPYQSEGDPSNSYPLSYYTTNMGASLNAFAGGAGTGAIISDYECPPDPRHPTSAFAETIYSSAAGPDGKYVISGNPGSASVDMNIDNPRSTFYLSKVKTGIFTVNINSYIAPNIVSQAATTPNPQGGGLPSLGWGASPRSTGTGTETCPADTATTGGVTNTDYVTIPSGYHWVKVWLFRMALPARQFLYGSNLQRIGQLACNPGNWSSAPTVSEVTDCAGLTVLGGGTAARFSTGTWMCFKPGTWTPNGVDTNYSCGKPNHAAYADPWSSTNTGGLDICDASGNPTNTAPFDNAPMAKYIDDPSSLRYEFLMVVTPKTVNSGDMSNSASPVYAQYAPFRFRVDNDCNNVNPTGCSSQYMFRNYGLKLHDVADAGDPPASDPNRAGVFPVCALQPDSVLGTGL